MKTIRQDRYKDFDQMVDDSKSCVADEMIFTSGPEFFKDMSKEEILKWANGCMEKRNYHSRGNGAANISVNR